jgi:CubicO group peptidase (beta-lactamase class C family)
MRLSILIILLSFISCKKTKQNTDIKLTNPVLLAIKKNADSLLLDEKINSVSIGIYKDGEKYTAHYGELDSGKKNQPTDETIYEIASVSKTYTGILVANAVLEGKINLNDDIRNYLDEPFPNFEYDTNPIKIKHLLSHTSRLPKFLPYEINDLFVDFNEELPFKVYNIQKNYTKKDFNEDLHHFELDTIPGTKYSYSNVDTELMAQILENVYQKSYNQLVKEYFGKAVKMTNTQILLSKEQEKHLANGYGMTNKLVPHETILYGADGGIKTTMPDLVNYMQFQLDSTNKTTLTSHSTIYEDKNRQMAYYWSIRHNDEFGTYFSIHGGGFGSQNWFFILPKYNLGISVITNQSDLETADKLLKTVNGLIKDLKYLK